MPSLKTYRLTFVRLVARWRCPLLLPIAAGVALLAVLGAAILFNVNGNPNSGQMPSLSPHEAEEQIPAPGEQPAGTPQTATANGFSFRLEVADTEEARRQGLSRRVSLAQDAAMLFVFPQEAYWSFWMKEVAFPLDLVYINGDGFIVSVQTMHPQLGVPEGQLKRYASPQPAKYALEVNGGLAAALGLEPGVKVELK